MVPYIPKVGRWRGKGCWKGWVGLETFVWLWGSFHWMIQNSQMGLSHDCFRVFFLILLHKSLLGHFLNSIQKSHPLKTAVATWSQFQAFPSSHTTTPVSPSQLINAFHSK